MVVRKSTKIDQRGFSLVELVVTIGLLLILSMAGVFAYSSFNDSAKKNTTENVASQAYKKVMAYAVDGESSTDPMSVDKEYNASQVKEAKKDRIYLHTEKLGNERYRVTAFMSEIEPTESNVKSLISSAKFFKTVETPATDGNGGTGENSDGSGDGTGGTGITPPITEVEVNPNIQNAFKPVASDTCTTTPDKVKLTNIKYVYGNLATTQDETTGQSFYVEFTMAETVANCFALEVDMNEFPIVPKTNSFAMNSGWNTTFTKVDDKWVINGVRNNNTFAKNERFRYRLDDVNYDYKTIAKTQVAQSNPVVENENPQSTTKSITFTSDVDFIANWKAEVDLSELEKNGKAPTIRKSYKGTNPTQEVGNQYTLTPVSGKPGLYTIENTVKGTALPGKNFSRTIVFQSN